MTLHKMSKKKKSIIDALYSVRKCPKVPSATALRLLPSISQFPEELPETPLRAPPTKAHQTLPNGVWSPRRSDRRAHTRTTAGVLEVSDRFDRFGRDDDGFHPEVVTSKIAKYQSLCSLEQDVHTAFCSLSSRK